MNKFGTLVISVVYRRGTREDEAIFSGTGSNPEGLLDNMVKNAKKKGWKIHNVKVLSSSFEREVN